MTTFSTTLFIHNNHQYTFKSVIYSHSASSMAALHQKLFTWDIA